MLKIAIVGNIAAGKSSVEDILSSYGFKVFDSDKIAHEILKNNQEVISAFNKFDIVDGNEISRKKLAKIVFGDENLKQKLESIIHPIVRKKIQEIFDENKEEKVVFVSIPLLFEANMQDLFDKIIFIQADDDIRLKRLIKRNNLTEEEALRRLNSQMNQTIKIGLSDYVLNNNSSLNNLTIEIDKLVKNLFSK